MTRRHRPEVVVTDVPVVGLDGYRIVRLICRELPSTRVVILAATVEEECVYRSLRAGASGFFEKGRASRELVDAVVAVHAGEVALSPAATWCVVDGFLRFDREQTQSARRKIDSVTTREREVLGYIIQGLGNAEIARTLYMSEGSVKAHVSHLLPKLGCSNRVQAAIVAHESGMFASKGESIQRISTPSLGVAS